MKRNKDHDRKQEVHSLDEALKDYLKINKKMESGLRKLNVEEVWYQEMGPGVRSYTTSVKLSRNTLYIQLSNAVLRQELSYGKTKIIQMMNENLGEEIVKKLVLC